MVPCQPEQQQQLASCSPRAGGLPAPAPPPPPPRPYPVCTVAAACRLSFPHDQRVLEGQRCAPLPSRPPRPPALGAPLPSWIQLFRPPRAGISKRQTNRCRNEAARGIQVGPCRRPLALAHNQMGGQDAAGQEAEQQRRIPTATIDCGQSYNRALFPPPLPRGGRSGMSSTSDVCSTITQTNKKHPTTHMGLALPAGPCCLPASDSAPQLGYACLRPSAAAGLCLPPGSAPQLGYACRSLSAAAGR